MVSFEIIWELLSSELKDTEFWPAIVGSTAIVIALGILLRKIKMIWRKIGAAAAAIGLLAAWDGFCLKWHSLLCYHLAGLLFALSVLCFLAPYLWSRHRLRSVKELCKQQAYVEALELLSTVKEGWLSSKQLQGYQKRMFFLLVNLGNLRKASAYLERIWGKEGAFCHFALHTLAFRSGNLKNAFLEIQKAEDSEDLKDDPLLQFQIILNRGVCYAAEGNYHLADEYYNKAIAFYNTHHLREEELRDAFYYNYAFNRLRLEPDAAAWQEVLEEYHSGLDLEKPDAQLRILNVRLELFRQTEAPREAIDDLLQRATSVITSGKLPLKNKVLFASSAARVAWAARVNPIPCLEILNENMSEIERLPAKQRYFVYAELDILFRDFHGPSSDSFASLKDRASDYLQKDAEKDLKKWQSELPGEAIYDRCDCLRKMAVLRRSRTPYDHESVVDIQKNAVRLYHDSGLYLDELYTRQDIMDELLDVRNRDEDYRPVYADELREQMSSAEELLSSLEGHPALAESYIRLGCYSFDLDEYEKGLCFARRFWRTGISVQNFAPGLRRYYADLLFRTRVILFDQAIRAAAGDPQLCSLGEAAQNWFATYPQHDGWLDTLLLGRFLSAPVGKTKVWIPKGESEPQGHTWLWIPQLEIDIDLTYPQFADDQLCRCVFFYNGRHPFEAGTSLTLQVSQQSSPLVFEGIACSQLEHGLSQEASALADTIYEFLCKHISKDCPSMEEFTRMIGEFIEVIPIQA